jgi:predicted tellurium resistance membrane protein TerC
MDRFPLIITLGGMLLGWIAGTMIHTDPGLVSYIPQEKVWNYGMGIAGALLVLVVGRAMGAKKAPAEA